MSGERQREQTLQNELDNAIEAITPSWWEILFMWALVLFAFPVVFVVYRVREWWND